MRDGQDKKGKKCKKEQYPQLLAVYHSKQNGPRYKNPFDDGPEYVSAKELVEIARLVGGVQ